MQEYWFCEACKSMNRGDADRCYRCRAPKARATMATVHERRIEDVLMPGVDRLEPGEARAMLAQHPYSAAWPIGYVSAVLLVVAAVFQFVLALVLAAPLLSLIRPSFALGNGWYVAVAGLSLGFTVASLVAAVAHSVFLGLTDMNVPSLGGGQPRFEPLRAGLWWIEAAGWALRAYLTVWIPLFIGLMAMEVLGLFGILLAMALLYMSGRLFRDPLYSLRKPVRLLDDLIRRLSVRGDTGGLASTWSIAWIAARLIDTLGPVLLTCAWLIAVAAAFVQAVRSANGGGPLYDLGQIVTEVYALSVLLLVLEVIANAIALCLLARLTLSLSSSQRVRRDWVVESAGRPSGLYPAGLPAGTVASPTDPPAGPAPAPVAPITQPAMWEPPRQSIVQPPAPPIARPRWIRTQDGLVGEDASEAPLPAEAPPAPERVLRPSSNALPRYGVPQWPETPVPPQAPAPQAPAPQQAPPDGTLPAEADWPEGI
jgi:hypothetical protein